MNFSYKYVCYPRLNTPIKINSFLPKNSVEKSIFQKTVFTFSSSFKFLLYSEDFWESTYKSPCSRSHTDSRLIGLIVFTQREKLYKSVFGLKRVCTRCCGLLGCKKSWTHLANGICQVVCKVLILSIQSQWIKENLKRVAWGLDVGHEDRTRINLLSLRLLYFLRFNFLYCKYFIFITLISLFECWRNILDPTIGIISGPTIGIRAQPGIQDLHTQSTTYKDGNGVSFVTIQRRTFYTTSTAIWRIQLQLLEV